MEQTTVRTRKPRDAGIEADRLDFERLRIEARKRFERAEQRKTVLAAADSDRHGIARGYHIVPVDGAAHLGKQFLYVFEFSHIITAFFISQKPPKHKRHFVKMYGGVRRNAKKTHENVKNAKNFDFF